MRKRGLAATVRTNSDGGTSSTIVSTRRVDDLVQAMGLSPGSLLMFGVGMILGGTLALLPSMMQVLMNYPVFDDDGTARRRHDDRDVCCRPADQAGRQPPVHPGWVPADRGSIERGLAKRRFAVPGLLDVDSFGIRLLHNLSWRSRNQTG